MNHDGEITVESALDGRRRNLERLPVYVALQTLHDLYWFLENEPDGYAQAHALKVPRALGLLEGGL